VPRHQTPRLNLRVDIASHSSLPAGDNQTFVIRENALARNTEARSDQPYDIFLVPTIVEARHMGIRVTLACDLDPQGNASVLRFIDSGH
jgi:hypothetical protein